MLGLVVQILVFILVVSKLSFLGASKIRLSLRSPQQNTGNYKCIQKAKHNNHTQIIPNILKSKSSKIPKNQKHPNIPKIPKIPKIPNIPKMTNIQRNPKFHKSPKFQKSKNPEIPEIQKSKNPKLQQSKTFHIYGILQNILDLGILGFWNFGTLDFWILGFWKFGFLEFWILGSVAIPVLLFDRNAASENQPKSDQQKGRFRTGFYSVVKGSACRRGVATFLYIYICNIHI